MRSSRIIGWGWLVICALAMITAFLSQFNWLGAGCALAALFGGYMVLGSGSFDIDGDGLTHRSSFGVWHIRWDEVSSVEIGEVEGTMVFKGDKKRFILSSPGGWDASVKDEALAFVFKQLETRGISVVTSRVAAYKIMKNTRVS